VFTIHTDLAHLYSKKVAFHRAPSMRSRRFAGLFEKPGNKNGGIRVVLNEWKRA
jgi:hypothetical protein